MSNKLQQKPEPKSKFEEMDNVIFFEIYEGVIYHVNDFDEKKGFLYSIDYIGFDDYQCNIYGVAEADIKLA